MSLLFVSVSSGLLIQC